jgi:hypothetical protein
MRLRNEFLLDLSRHGLSVRLVEIRAKSIGFVHQRESDSTLIEQQVA